MKEKLGLMCVCQPPGAEEDRNGMFLTLPVSLDCFPGTSPAKGRSWQLDALLVTMLPIPTWAGRG